MRELRKVKGNRGEAWEEMMNIEEKDGIYMKDEREERKIVRRLRRGMNYLDIHKLDWK